MIYPAPLPKATEDPEVRLNNPLHGLGYVLPILLVFWSVVGLVIWAVVAL